jgi:hypothetical protein
MDEAAPPYRNAEPGDGESEATAIVTAATAAHRLTPIFRSL